MAKVLVSLEDGLLRRIDRAAREVDQHAQALFFIDRAIESLRDEPSDRPGSDGAGVRTLP